MRRISLRHPPGLTFQEAVNVAKKRIGPGLYLIQRHGGWFRPGAQGYTRNLSEAGLFSAEKARSYINVDGLSVVPVAEIAATLDAEIADLKAKIASAERLHATILTSAPAQPAVVATCRPKGVSPLVIGYDNWRGEYAVRRIIPDCVRYGSTEWHPEPQWLLEAHDVEKDATRLFAMKDMTAPVDRAAVVTAQRLATALRDAMPLIEEAESARLVGDEGCLWPAENARAALNEAVEAGLLEASPPSLNSDPENAVQPSELATDAFPLARPFPPSNNDQPAEAGDTKDR